MAVKLNGFENTPKEERRVLSEDEFKNYIKDTELSYDEIIGNYIYGEIIKRGKVNLESLYEDFGVDSKEEIIQIFEEETGINLLTDDTKELIKDIPEEILAQIGDLDSIIDNCKTLEEVEELIDSTIFKQLEKEFNERLINIATEVSKCNLNQISPELYANANFLQYINFQNTGAKLDFEYIKENRKNIDIFISSKNLKGTELIFFNDFLYKTKIKTKSSFSDFEYMVINIENFDVSQYQTVIDSYNKADKYIPSEISKFLANQELQDNNKWLIEYAFGDLEKNRWLAENIWKQMTAKTQLENKDTFIKYIDYCIRYENRAEDRFLITSTIQSTQPEILVENAEKIKQCYINKDGSMDKKFYSSVFNHFSDEYKEKYYENEQNISLEEKVIILSKTNSEYFNKNCLELFENCRENNEYNFYEIGAMIKHWSNCKFDKNNMEQLLNLASEESRNNKYEYFKFVDYIFSSLNFENQIDYYKSVMQIGIDNNVPVEYITKVFESIKSNKKEYFDEILDFSKTLSPELAHNIRGTGYINMVQKMPKKEKKAFIEKNSKDILLSLITKFEEYSANSSYYPQEKEEFYSNYPKEYISILLDMENKGELNISNAQIIIDNLPKLGEDFINRIYKSNSDMIRANSNQLIVTVATLEKEQALEVVKATEGIFSKDTIPDFFKMYKFYENVIENSRGLIQEAIDGRNNKYSPELQQANSKNEGMRIIFSDLLNISLKSNNKSLKSFFKILENGNETYIKYLNNGKKLDSLTEEEKDLLKQYSSTLYTLYEESAVSNIDSKEHNRKIKNTKDYMKTLDDLSKRYIGNSFPNDLSNEVLKTIIVGTEELLAGRRTVQEFKEYMRNNQKESNKRHAKLEKTKLKLEPGDIIKGVRNGKEYLQSIFENGCRAGEFLGVDNHTDATPLDSDHSVILPNNPGKTLKETFQHTASMAYADYDSFYLVIKKNSQKINYTRDDPEYVFESKEAPKYKSKLGKNADRETIKAKINNRINKAFEEPKLEAFSSDVVGKDHYGIRTGVAITDIDYIVVDGYDKRIGYELAMNGTFVPVVDINSNEVVFGVEDYKKIREQMQGLSYFETKKFEVDQSAYNAKVEEKVAELFPNGEEKESISEKEARVKREAIERKVRSAVLEKLQLGFKTKITGDITPGFIEFIDTGSTGRGTNLPGDGDFDFSVKLDKNIIDDENKLMELKSTLREVLGVPSKDEDCKLDEFNGNFRYKKVKIDEEQPPLDIDITFMQKSEEVRFSTDMAVKERLDGIKENDPEGYKRVIANIVVAKEMLKKEGIYKKEGSGGATEKGGFGGVGVENWILQNGGSFTNAMKTFLEASEQAKNFEKFKEIYPIFDFGQNHKTTSYSHDCFINGLTENGYISMKEKFKEFIQELEPKIEKEVPDVETEVMEKLGQELPREISMKKLAQNALVKQEIRAGEFNDATKNIDKDDMQLDTDKDFMGED